MPLGSRALQSALVSHAQRLGLFETVNGHEPKSTPGQGVTCSIFAAGVRPARSSGVSRTSAVVTFSVRAQTPMTGDPQDDIDVTLLDAVDGLVNAYAGDFELGGNVRAVDLRGMEGTPLTVEFGYLEHGGTMFRFGELTVPLIVNDVWTESP